MGLRIKHRYAVDPITGCWNWLLSKDTRGYGQVRIGGKTFRAHRLSYEEHKGVIPDGNQLDHTCHNRACINPDHLEPVTNAVNCQRGLKAKLTPEQVVEVRMAFAGGVLRSELARRYGVTHKTIRSIVVNKSWRSHVA